MNNVVTTKYLGATNTRGSRIKAAAHGHILTVPIDFELSDAGNHEAAARALMAKIDAGATLTAHGRLPNAAGFVFIFSI